MPPPPPLSSISPKSKLSNGLGNCDVFKVNAFSSPPYICCTVLWNLIKFHERRSKTEIHTWMAQPPNNLQWLMNSEICQILFRRALSMYRTESRSIPLQPIAIWSLRNVHKITGVPLKYASSQMHRKKVGLKVNRNAQHTVAALECVHARKREKNKHYNTYLNVSELA